MRVHLIGTLVFRVLGTVFIVYGVFALFQAFILPLLYLPAGSSGWTTYAPLVPPAATPRPRNFFDVTYSRFYLAVPSLFSILFGWLLSRFSKSLGRLLTRGLSDDAA